VSSQPALFDVKRMGPISCRACGATQKPDELTAPACTYDRDRAAGIDTPRRPTGCLNKYDQQNAQIPF
jgi:hypothetical protein